MKANSEIRLMVTSNHGMSGDGAEEGDGDAERHPAGQRQAQEEGEDDEHQHEAGAAVAKQGVEAAAQDAALVGPGGERQARGQPPVLLLDVALDRRGDVDGVLLADAEDLHHHRRLAVEARRLVGVGEAVDHLRHVADRQAACRRAG